MLNDFSKSVKKVDFQIYKYRTLWEIRGESPDWLRLPLSFLWACFSCVNMEIPTEGNLRARF